MRSRVKRPHRSLDAKTELSEAKPESCTNWNWSNLAVEAPLRNIPGGVTMPKKQHAEAAIISALKQYEGGEKTTDICRKPWSPPGHVLCLEEAVRRSRCTGAANVAFAPRSERAAEADRRRSDPGPPDSLVEIGTKIRGASIGAWPCRDWPCLGWQAGIYCSGRGVQVQGDNSATMVSTSVRFW